MNNLAVLKERVIRLLGNLGLAVATWFLSFLALLPLIPSQDASSSSGVQVLTVLVVPFVAAYVVVRLANWNRKRNKEKELHALEAKRRNVAEQLQRDQRELDEGIAKHRHILMRNYRKAVQKNDYGAVTSACALALAIRTPSFR